MIRDALDRVDDAALADAAQDCTKLAGDDAIRACDQVIDQDSLSANAYIAYYNRGLRYRVKGDLDRAIADFTSAIEIAPKFAAAYTNRCWLRALANRDLPPALADCDVAIRLAPLDPAAISARGYAYYRLNRFDEDGADHRDYQPGLLASTPKACTDFDIPLQLLVGICLDLAPKLLTDCGRMLRNIVGRQWAFAVPQIGQAFLDFGELQRMQPLRLSGVSRAQTEALLALPEKVAQVIRNTLPEPVIAAVRMLPGSRHRKSHVYHPCVPIRAAKAYDNQRPVDLIGFLRVLAERESDKLSLSVDRHRPPSI